MLRRLGDPSAFRPILHACTYRFTRGTIFKKATKRTNYARLERKRKSTTESRAESRDLSKDRQLEETGYPRRAANNAFYRVLSMELPKIRGTLRHRVSFCAYFVSSRRPKEYTVSRLEAATR